MENKEESRQYSNFQHISRSVDESIEYLRSAQKGDIRYFQTKWKKFNKNLLGGLHPGKLYVIAGRPGSGKSAFANRMIFDMLDMNHEKSLKVLYWNFEMPSYQQIMRASLKYVNKSLYQLMSIENKLSDDDLAFYERMVDRFRKYPIFFNDVPKSIEYIKEKNYKAYEKDDTKTIINVFDHSRLIRSKNESSELDRLIKLSHGCMEMQAEIKCINILLSQLNRNIERPERKETLYQPLLSDLFGSDSIGQDASVVMMINRPRDLYDIKEPYLGENTNNLLALHIEKNRDGILGMIPFDANMSRFDIEERKPNKEQLNLSLT